MKVMQYRAENSTSFGKYWTVYLPAGAAEESLPAEIRAQLGTLYPQEELEVETDKYLAAEQKDAILEAIASKGYSLEELAFKLPGLESDGAENGVDIEI